MNGMSLAQGAVLLPSLALAAAGAEPLHRLFWQEGDVREPEAVRFSAHPFPEAGMQVLVEPEEGRPALWHMPTDVVSDGHDLRVYYQRVDRGEAEYLNQRVWCLGVLGPDGFVRPDLGLFPQPWPGPRNVVLQRSPHTPTWGGFNVFQTLRPGDGLTVVYWDHPAEGPAGGMLATSADGVHWTKTGQAAVFTEHNDAYTISRDPAGGGYLMYQTLLKPWPEKPLPDNLPGVRRVISLRRSSDLRAWSPQEVVLEPDAEDGPAAEFYLLKTMPYVDRRVGLLMKYRANPELPNRHSDIVPNELVLSRDGRTWERPFRETELGLWSYADLFVYQGQLCAVAHRRRGLVLARTRLDGLASVGTEGQGSFVTPPFRLPREELRLNADCRGGSIRAELRSAAGQPLAQCRIEDADGVSLPIVWENDAAQDLDGSEVAIRFELSRAQVYALRAGTGP